MQAEMSADPRVTAAVRAMAAMVENSPIFTATVDDPTGLPSQGRSDALHSTLIVIKYAHATNDNSLWTLVGRILEALYPQFYEDKSIADIDGYTLEVMGQVMAYQNHWRQFSWMDVRVPRALAHLALTWHAALALDPRHDAFLDNNSADLIADRTWLYTFLR